MPSSKEERGLFSRRLIPWMPFVPSNKHSRILCRPIPCGPQRLNILTGKNYLIDTARKFLHFLLTHEQCPSEPAHDAINVGIWLCRRRAGQSNAVECR